MNTVSNASALIRGRHRPLLLSCALALGGAGCAGEAGAEAEEGQALAAEDEIGETQQALVDGCSAILMNGVHDELISTSNGQDAFALAKAACREEANSASGGGGLGIGLFGASGSASASSWDKFCESYNISSSSSETTSLLTRTANQGIVNSWLQCMTNVGTTLVCYQKPGENVISFTYRDPDKLGDIVDSVLTVDPNLTTPRAQRQLIAPTLRFGETLLNFTIRNEGIDSGISFTGDTAVTGKRMSCSVLIKSPGTIKREMALPWTNLGIMYRDLGTAVDAISAGAPNEIESGPYNAFLLHYWNAAVKSNDCTTLSPTCVAPPIAKDYTFSITIPGFRCRGPSIDISVKPMPITRNVLVVATSEIVTLIRNRSNQWNSFKTRPGTTCQIVSST